MLPEGYPSMTWHNGSTGTSRSNERGTIQMGCKPMITVEKREIIERFDVALRNTRMLCHFSRPPGRPTYVQRTFGSIIFIAYEEHVLPHLGWPKPELFLFKCQRREHVLFVPVLHHSLRILNHGAIVALSAGQRESWSANILLNMTYRTNRHDSAVLLETSMRFH